MKHCVSADTVVVLDFETTGLSPDYGDRAIEIGAVKVHQGEIIDEFQQLMNPGVKINSFIENYTGISNTMLAQAMPVKEVMLAFHKFIDGYNLVAHNASFDARFLQAELKRVKRRQSAEFACSMLIARRVYQQAPDHKLGTLVEYLKLPNDGTFHRALADARMTAYLWMAMMADIKKQYPLNDVSYQLMQKLSRTSKKMTNDFLTRAARKKD